MPTIRLLSPWPWHMFFFFSFRSDLDFRAMRARASRTDNVHARGFIYLFLFSRLDYFILLLLLFSLRLTDGVDRVTIYEPCIYSFIIYI